MGKNEPVCIADEVPFEIPESWEWVLHNELFQISGGSQPPKSKFISEPQNGYIRLYQIRDYGDNPIPVYIPISTASKISKKGDILLARYGASLGKVFWAEDGAYNVAMARVIPLYKNELIYKEYLFLFYQSNLYQELIHSNSRSAQAGFNKEDLNKLFLPVPPFDEQIRMVDAYKKLQPFVTDYEKKEEILNTLNTDFSTQLKKSILQEAVQGKLVPQDPSDEPASVLLKRIRAEKERLIQEGKFKRDKHESVIYRRDNSHYEKRGSDVICINDEIPFDIPECWTWCRLGNIIESIDAGKSFKCDERPPEQNEYGIVKISAVTWGSFKQEESKTCYSANQWVENYAIHAGDFLICRANTAALVGGCVVVDKISKHLMLSDKVLRLNLSIDVSKFYLLYVLRTPFIRAKLNAAASGTSESMKNISQDVIKRLLIPIPPIEEQQRIVSRLKKVLPIATL